MNIAKIAKARRVAAIVWGLTDGELLRSRELITGAIDDLSNALSELGFLCRPSRGGWTDDEGRQLYAMPDCINCGGSGYGYDNDESYPCDCPRYTKKQWFELGIEV